MSDITLQNIVLSYPNGVQALSGISHIFPHGQFAVIVGASGCGKSTLLRILAGLLSPTSGTLQIPPARDIGFVFQEPTLLDWRTVYDNIALPLKISGVAKADVQTRTREALQLVGLAARADARPRELSGGMKMRVSLARALARRPRLLLMDEPFAALDEITRFRLEDDIRQLWRDIGCTIIFVTHSITEAAYLGECVLVMDESGRLARNIQIAHHDNTSDFRTTQDFHNACTAISETLTQARYPS